MVLRSCFLLPRVLDRRRRGALKPDGARCNRARIATLQRGWCSPQPIPYAHQRCRSLLSTLSPPRGTPVRDAEIAIERPATELLPAGSFPGGFRTPAPRPVPTCATASIRNPSQKQKPKRKGPPSSVTVINATASPVAGVVITAGDKTTKLSKPLAPKARATVKLPKMQGCTVSVAATFEGGGKSDAETFDVCKDKSIRFTD